MSLVFRLLSVVLFASASLSGISLAAPARPVVNGISITPDENGNATIGCSVMTNGAATTLTISLSPSDSDPKNTPLVETLPDSLISQSRSKTFIKLTHGAEYTYTITASNSAGDAVLATGEINPLSAKFVENVPPTAKSDTAVLTDLGSLVINVAANDRDPDPGDRARLQAKSIVTPPVHGRAQIVGGKVVYSRSTSFHGTDTFTYSVTDQYPLLPGFQPSTATVTVLGIRFVIVGPAGAVITDNNGRPAGYVQINTLVTGVFSGQLRLGSKAYSLHGQFDPTGHFRGVATAEDGKFLPVDLRFAQAGNTVRLNGVFGAGDLIAVQETTTKTPLELAKLEARYTVELPPQSTSGSGDTASATTDHTAPQGSGWMTIRVNKAGIARIEGKSGDGRGFSAQAVLGGTGDSPELSFVAGPKHTLMSGVLTLGDTVSGDVTWTRDQTDSTFFPNGFDLTIAATGSRYTPPKKGWRSLASDSTDAGRVTLAVSGGGMDDFSHTVRLSENDKGRVLDEADDEINLKIDRKSGVFRGKFRDVNDRDRRIKFTGVLLQHQGRGAGVFLGNDKTGRVQVSLASSSGSDNSGGSSGSGGSNGSGGSSGSGGSTGGSTGGDSTGTPDDGTIDVPLPDTSFEF